MGWKKDEEGEIGGEREGERERQDERGGKRVGGEKRERGREYVRGVCVKKRKFVNSL